MNNDLFINRAQLPQIDPKQESNDHTQPKHMNLFGQVPGASLVPKQNNARVHNPTQQQEKPMDMKEKPMTAEEVRAMTQHMPRSLGAAVGVAMPPRSDKQAQAQGEGQGGRQGGQERPSHSSYYSPVPVGGIAMPKRGSEIGDAVVQNEQAKRRTNSRSI